MGRWGRQTEVSSTGPQRVGLSRERDHPTRLPLRSERCILESSLLCVAQWHRVVRQKTMRSFRRGPRSVVQEAAQSRIIPHCVGETDVQTMISEISNFCSQIISVAEVGVNEEVQEKKVEHKGLVKFSPTQ